jgi:hypothetical protein
VRTLPHPTQGPPASSPGAPLIRSPLAPRSPRPSREVCGSCAEARAEMRCCCIWPRCVGGGAPPSRAGGQAHARTFPPPFGGGGRAPRAPAVSELMGDNMNAAGLRGDRKSAFGRDGLCRRQPHPGTATTVGPPSCSARSRRNPRVSCARLNFIFVWHLCVCIHTSQESALLSWSR